jgi:hypothetical protein
LRRIWLVFVAVTLAAILGFVGLASAQDSTTPADSTTPSTSGDPTIAAAFTLTEAAPPGNTTGISRGTNVRAGFNKNLDKATVNQNNFQLLDQTNGGTKVSAKLSIDNSPSSTWVPSTTSYAILNPTNNLKSGHKYKVIVDAGSDGVLSTSGNTIKDVTAPNVTFKNNRVSWIFTVA